MNILGIDYGKKRIGLAWVDTALGVVLPYGVVEIDGDDLGIKNLVALIKKERIEKLIIGLPLGLDGKENTNTKLVREFCQRIEAEVKQPVVLVDERFSTQQAQRLGGDASLDEKSAMIILETYLAK